MINCPECKKEISDSAKACPSCGHSINDWNPSAAAILSLIIPGAGQMYKGNMNIVYGFIWLLLAVVGYIAFVIPGIIIHIICIIDAATVKK